MSTFQLHVGEAPDDVFIQYPGKAYLSAKIRHDSRPGHEGDVLLTAEIAYQSDKLEMTLHTVNAVFKSVLEARDYVLVLAEGNQVANVYLIEP